MTFIPGGTFTMGSERHQPEERSLTLSGRRLLDRPHEVTNAQFRQFVDATGYVTLAERGLDPKTHPRHGKDLLVPGSVVFIQPTEVKRGGSSRNWWQYMPAPTGVSPTGPGSSIAGKDNHPVVHVAYEDALAYARWRGRSLPTEAQWEFAARGGRDGEDDWSSAFDADGKPIANTWQGIFPVLNTQRRRLRRHRAGRLLQAERLRPLRHDRQRLGVDERLVPAGPSARSQRPIPPAPTCVSIRARAGPVCRAA